MGLFGKLWKAAYDEPDIYDEDEVDELITDSELYVEAPPLESTVVTVTPKDIYRIDMAAVLENIAELPYEFRCYLDTRRAFTKAFEQCREEIVGYESYEGGRSAEYSAGFGYDDHDITIDFTLSRDSDGSPYRFTADIKVDE